MRAVARGRTYIDPSIGRDAIVPEVLTARETEVLRHVALGLSNKDIAAALSVREETVKTHVTTPREVEVPRHVDLQALNKGIAWPCRCRRAVKTHVTHVLAKLEVDNRAQAIVQALKKGIVALDELE